MSSSLARGCHLACCRVPCGRNVICAACHPAGANDNDTLTDRLALMTERWLRAEEDAERLAESLALVRARSNIAEYLDAEGHLSVIHALEAHDKRKAEEA